MANRMWAHFFGIGILDPVDEPGENNPPSHPELIDDLGKAFAENGFDTQFLIRAITRTKAYQLSSKMTHPGQADRRRFARMNLKGLTPALCSIRSSRRPDSANRLTCGSSRT